MVRTDHVLLLGNSPSTVLPSLLFIAVALAFPQQGAPYLNGTAVVWPSPRPSPTTSTDTTCKVACAAGAISYLHAYWAVGLRDTRVGDETNTTGPNIIDSNTSIGRRRRGVNAAGTRVETFILSDYIAKTSYSIALTYPTAFNDFIYSYQWAGVLPTSTNGQSTCTTGDWYDELFLSRLPPSWPPFEEQPLPREDDEFGLNAQVLWGVEGPTYGDSFYFSAVPTTAAYRSCRQYYPNNTAMRPRGQIIGTWTTAQALIPTSAAPEDNLRVTEASTTQDFTPGAPITPSTVDANPTPTGATQGNDQSSRMPESNSDIPVPAPALDANPTPNGSRKGNGQSRVAFKTQDSSSGASNAPPAGELDPTPTGVSDPSTFAPPIVTSSSAQQQSIAFLDSPFPASNIPVDTPSKVQEQNLVSVFAQSVDLEPSSTTANLPGPGVSASEASKESPTRSVGASVSMLAATVSLLPEPDNPRLDNQNSTNSRQTSTPLALTIGSSEFTANSATQFDIAPGITLAPGGPAQTVSGTTISLAPLASWVAINDETFTLAPPPPPPPTPSPILAYPVLTIGGNTYTANSATQYEIAPGITVAPGGPAQTISGTTISLAPSASYIVVNDVTLTLPAISSPRPTPTPPVLVIGGSSFIANSATQYEIAPGLTLRPGGPARTVSGTVISLAPSASYIVVNDVTLTLAAAAAASASPASLLPPILTIGGTAYPANYGTQYEIAPGKTVVPGGPAETISGTTISLALSASYVVINGVTSTLEPATFTSVPGLASPGRTISGSVYTAQSGSQYIIEGQTLGLGLSLTIGSASSRMLVELLTNSNGATELVVGVGNSMSTSTLTSAGAVISLPVVIPTKTPPPLSLDGKPYSADSLTHYSLAPGLTLTPGGVVTLNGTKISLAPSGSFALVGSSTETLLAPGTTMMTTTEAGASGEPGGFITSGVGGGNASRSSNTPTSVSGVGGRMGVRSNELCRMWLIGMISATVLVSYKSHDKD